MFLLNDHKYTLGSTANALIVPGLNGLAGKNIDLERYDPPTESQR